MSRFTWKQILAIILFELLIVVVSGLLIGQFFFTPKEGSMSLKIFCLVMGILLFIGLNIFMIVMIKRLRRRAKGGL